MLRRSFKLAWTPNYFRQGRRTHHPSVKAVVPKRVAATAGTPKCGSAKRPHKPGENPAWVSSSHYVNTQLTRLGITEEENSEKRSARERLVRTAHELHSEWEQLPTLLPIKTRDDRRAYLCFQTLQNVLGPLSSFLRAPLQPHTGSLGDYPLKRYCIVEDSEIVDGRAPPQAPVTSEGTIPSSSSRDFGLTFFSLEDLFIFLNLYLRVESEDGRLLRQLLDEVNRFLGGNGMPVLGTSSAESMRVRLPLPQLLFTLSEIGIADEYMLQAVVSRAMERDPHQHSDDLKARGLLYSNLPLYGVQDLLVLIVALYRFGMQQDYAFERTIKALRVLMWKSDSPLAYLQRTAKKLEKDSLSHPSWGSRDEAVEEVEGSVPVQSELWLQRFPKFGKDLQCPLGVLVEVVTALSVSVFRPRDVLALVANLLVVSAHVELQTVLRSSLVGPEERKFTMLAISHQLHRAVHLYEEMNALQPLLAELFAWSCTVSKVGVLMDGGEDAAIPSESRAYYDHVTADLVKVNRA
ncbi:unnamed protein product [Phytomonas sp. EM1]|nr:unnamed protein product [Phytomonas sp. EM1]|eukprot:CCW63317.1 unnamed protein product [Phytomonas sp. isolate EM1]